MDYTRPPPSEEELSLPPDADEPLPTYAEARASRLPTVHAFHLVKSDGHRWLTLSLRSSAGTPEQRPYFFGGDRVEGHVALDLKEPATFRAIDVMINGRLTLNSVSRRVFLTLHKTVWHAAESEPAPSSIVQRVLRQSGETITGTHSFPFSFELPEQIDDGHQTHLPASFGEQGARYAVDYSIAVQVRRVGLSADSWILEPLVYCPAIRPGPFPEARRMAYERKDGNITGPESSPDAWETLSPIELTGTLFGSEPASITCQLSLAKPLIYTRGTPIPLSLLLTSSNTQALDLLAAPTAPAIKLVCNSFSIAPKTRYTITDTDVRDVQHANWWPAAAPEGSRRLMGEIHLSTSLKPGARLPSWKLAYAVVMHAPRVPGFVPTVSAKRGERDTPLQVAEVAIASMHARGMPRPVAASAVAHDAAGSWRREGELDRTWTALVLDHNAHQAMLYDPAMVTGT